MVIDVAHTYESLLYYFMPVYRQEYRNSRHEIENNSSVHHLVSSGIVTNGFYLGYEEGRNVKLTTHFSLLLRLICGVYLHFQYTFLGVGLVLTLRALQESVVARQDVCVLLPSCEGELRSEVDIQR